MLSVVSIKRSSITNSYYLQQDGGYYIEDASQKELYQWLGKGAAKLGLTGSIHRQDHERIFTGQLPGDILIGKRAPDGTFIGRPGYDLTFSMNKDISLIICCCQDKTLRDYFLNAHLNAVKTAMYEVEKIAVARKTEKGNTQYELTQNMVAALCTHFSSRAGDPQVHTHALVANMTERSDEEWRALATDMQRRYGFYEKLRDKATFLGHLYQNEMAHAAVKMGFKVQTINKHGMFELIHFPDDIRQHFSKRRQQIKAIVNSLNPMSKNNQKLYGEVAQHSKPSKSTIQHKHFFQRSKQAMATFLQQQRPGHSFDDIVQMCKNPVEKVIEIGQTASDSIDDAIEKVSSFRTRFDANKIIEAAISLDLGRSSLSELRAALEAQIQKGQLLKTDSNHLTSKALIEREQKFIANVQRRLPTSVTTPSTPKTDESIIDETSRLTILTTPNTLEKKLVMLDRLIDQFEAKGKRVVVLTQTNSMAVNQNKRELAKATGFWQRLKVLNKVDRAVSISGFLHRYAKSLSDPVDNYFTKSGSEVFLVDNSHRMGITAAEKLIELTEKRQARLIFLDELNSRRSPLASDLMLLLEKAGVARVESRLRDRQESRHPIACQFREVAKDPNAVGHQLQSVRQRQVALDVIREHGEHLSQVTLYSHTKMAAHKFSNAVRAELIATDRLGKDEVTITVEQPVFLTNYQQKNAKFFKAGMMTKTYVRRGRYETQTIIRVDEKNNRLFVEDTEGSSKYIKPSALITDTDKTKLYQQKTLQLADGERIRLNSVTRESRQLGLSLSQRYQLQLKGKKSILQPLDETKPITVRLDQLNGLNLSHDYVKSVSQIEVLEKQSTQAILAIPTYAIDRNTLQDVSRAHASLVVYTDDVEKAKKQSGGASHPELASDIPLAPEEGSPMQRAMAYGLAVVSSREAAFLLEDLIQAVFKHEHTFFSYKQIKEAIGEYIDQGLLLTRSAPMGEVLLATQKTVALERDIISQICQGQGKVVPFFSVTDIQKRLANSLLTSGQKEACQLLASTADRFVMVQGYAGTGKSTMLETLKSQLEQHFTVKDTIIALAPTHKAVKELHTKGLKAQTLKSFLIEQNKTPNDQSLNHKLILLDESSMVSNRDFKALQTIVASSENCHCAYIGDIAQLAPVEDGKPSELAYFANEANIKVATMHEVLRQKNPTLKTIATQLMRGGEDEVGNALQAIETNGWVYEPDKTVMKQHALAAADMQQETKTIKGSEDNLPEQPSKIDFAIEQLATDYARLPNSERQQTLVAVATNQSRRAVNNAIRAKLQNKGVLSEVTLPIVILSNSGLTDEELRYAQEYFDGQTMKVHGHYYDIIKVSRVDNSVTVRDAFGQRQCFRLDWLPKQTNLELYNTEQRSIQKGDELKWTKSDRTRGRIAHETLVVVGINAKQKHIRVKKENGRHMNIDLTQRHNQHIDYNYASTVHGLQGATTKRVLTLLISPCEKAQSQRLLYVATTRATQEARFYVDDFALIRNQLLANKGDKASALDAMGLLTKRLYQQPPSAFMPSAPQKAKAPAPFVPPKQAHVPRQKRKQADRQPSIDAKQLERTLREDVKTICEQVLGEPNQTLSNATQWRYGKKGSLAVRVDGEHRGSFYNFETGEKGGMLQLLMSEMSMDFKTALTAGKQMLGSQAMLMNRPPPTKTRPVDHNNKKTDQARKKAYMNSIIKQSIPIKNTGAEKYLVSRGIHSPDHCDLRFIQQIKTGGGNFAIRSSASALLAIAKDSHGNIQAIQVTYLDPKMGTKIDALPIQKRTIGSLKTASVNLSTNVKSPTITFVAEGVETALTIKDALKSLPHNTVQVVATLGKSNFANKVHDNTANQVVLVLDNDKVDWRADKMIQSAIEKLTHAGKQVACMQPKLLHQQKTDYNDVAKAGMDQVIVNDIKQALDTFDNKSKDGIDTQLKKESPSMSLNLDSPNRRQALDRELFG